MTTEIVLQPIAATAATFAPYGQLIEPQPDGTPFGPTDAALMLGAGTPRLYIMRLEARPLRFERITRHIRVTQCLAALGDKEWLLGVAPPVEPDDPQRMPAPDAIRAFRIPGGIAVKLHRGTWHAGPFFAGDQVDFLNLELADTNEVDHVNCHLTRDLGLAFRFGA